jgi:hypothetical protein
MVHRTTVSLVSAIPNEPPLSLVCIQMNDKVATGEQAIPPLSEWKFCDLDSETKLQSKMCIYDDQLYDVSRSTMGFDVCADEFSEGVYIFDDSFENWDNRSHSSNRMRSAKWSDIVNAKPTNYCGSAPAADRGLVPGSLALSFGGKRTEGRERGRITVLCHARGFSYVCAVLRSRVR